MTPAKKTGLNVSTNLLNRLVTDKINEKSAFLQWS